MKKVLFITVAFLIAATSFSQTEKQKTEKKVTETKVALVVKKVTPAIKKGAKTTEMKGANETSIAPQVVEAPKMQIASLEKEQAVSMPVQTAPQAPAVDVNKAFEFKNDAFDFGKIPAGKPTKYELSIKNVSKETAELTLVQPGCGCTTPEYEQKKKFAPGEIVKVILGFNGGAPGNGSPFSKSVTVTLNGNLTKVVTFKGETYAVPTESAPANGAIDKLKPAAEETKH